MTTPLDRLLARRDELQAEAAPLRERLQRADDVIAAADKALLLRDELLAVDDRRIADSIACGGFARK
jgi:hypothetical protein